MIEVMSGVFLLAVMTGLIFVRFSRPTARVTFSNSIVIAPLNGRQTLMIRVGNQRQHSMVEAEFRIMFNRDEPLVEGGEFRYFYDLKLQFDLLSTFPAALTLRHVIDERRRRSMARTSNPSGIPGPVYCIRRWHRSGCSGPEPVPHTWRDIRFGERFVEIYTDHRDGRLTVDYGKLHDTEPAA